MTDLLIEDNFRGDMLGPRSIGEAASISKHRAEVATLMIHLKEAALRFSRLKICRKELLPQIVVLGLKGGSTLHHVFGECLVDRHGIICWQAMEHTSHR
ncbi:MAG TPA: hypothetical protein VF283_05040 [Bryobacteraceae bacterium]